jgi:bifunctional ADP-heptose synthase (sugar kinase/adenylyltransferase)
LARRLQRIADIALKPAAFSRRRTRSGQVQNLVRPEITMAANLSDWFDAFPGLRVAVLGEAMLDTHLEGNPSRFCPEAPAPIVSLSSRHDLPGAAANTAVNAARLGAQVTLLSVIGEDELDARRNGRICVRTEEKYCQTKTRGNRKGTTIGRRR